MTSGRPEVPAASPRRPGRRRGTGRAPVRGRLGLPACLPAFLLAFLPACGGEVPATSLVIVTLDTTRADHLSCYGHPLPLTPNIDRLAARGVVFDRAYAPMGQTLPSHATLFTGLPPRGHGALENHYVVREDVTTLAEELRDRGFATAGFVGCRVLDAETGIAQGFDAWDETGRRRTLERRVAERRADEVVDAVLAWADEQRPSGPFLLWTQFYDPHPPLEAPEPWASLPDQGVVGDLLLQRQDEFQAVGHAPARFDAPRMVEFWSDYAAEVLYTDHQVGRMLDGLRDRGLLERAAIVVLGDHGEGLMEHGEKGHGVNLYEEVMRIPLIVVPAGGREGALRIAEPVALEQMHGALLELALPDAEDRPRGGANVWREVLERGAPRPRPVVLERPHYAEDVLRERRDSFHPEGHLFGTMVAVIDGDHKLVRHPDGVEHLFDLASDPAEIEDRAAREPEVLARLRGVLDAWLRAHPVGEGSVETIISEEHREALDQLGYGR